MKNKKQIKDEITITIHLGKVVSKTELNKS